MGPTVVLVGMVLGLLVLLELENAVFDAVVQGIAKDAARKETLPIYLFVPLLVRNLLGIVALIGRTTSLYMHELSHALAQFVFGGRPRVVILKNGGYAQARPWGGSAPAKVIYAVGGFLGRGIMCLAPIVVGATLLVITLVGLTALTRGGVVDIGTIVGADPLHATNDVLAATWRAIAMAKWWAYPLMIVLALLLAPSMTPSSVDYIHGRMHVLAYALAAIVVGAVAVRAPHALWIVAPVAAVAGFASILRGPDWTRSLFGGFGLSLAVMAIVLATRAVPIVALNTALGVIVFALCIAAATYTVLVAVFLALSLISIRPRTLWYALAAVPGQLFDIVRSFDTCESCKVHYRGECDGCGRTPSDPAVPS